MRAFLSLAAAVLISIGIGIGGLAVAGSTTSSVQPIVDSIDLPTSFAFFSINSSGSSIELQGTQGASTADCVSALVNTSELRLFQPLISSCNDPFEGLPPSQTVTAVTSEPFSIAAKVRIARVNPITHRITYGPVVLTYEDASDTHLIQTYGDGSLWVFDTLTPQGAVVLRVSPKTGAVENRIHVPDDPDRPMLVTNDDGLWMAVQVNGGFGNGSTRNGAPIIHIASGSNTATIVHRSGYGAFWIAAAGQRVWVDVPSMPGGGQVTQRLWSFKGPSAQVVYFRNISKMSVQDVAGDSSGDLYALLAPTNARYGCSGPEEVVKFDPTTGQSSKYDWLPSETITSPYGCQLLGQSEQMTLTNGSLYLLYQATDDTGYDGYAKLFRISANS